MAAQVGAGEVAHQVQLGDLHDTAQTAVPRTQRRRREAEAMHARVQLQPDIQRGRQVGGQQGLRLLLALHRHIQPQLSSQQIFRRLETAFQQQDARIRVNGAHLHRLFQTGHSETISLVAQGTDHLAHAMAVGIRLDHRERLAARRTAFGQRVVVADRGKVDGGDEGAHFVES
ncbi:hypothetical protein D9M71_568730 [compost metagenome]